jgi:replicative DNA helicase
MINRTQEQAVVGCLLHDAERTYPLCIEHGLTEEAFNDRTLQLIYSTTTALCDGGGIVDWTSVNAALEKAGQLARCSRAMEGALENAPSISQAEHYITGVADAHRALKLGQELNRLRTEGLTGDALAAEMMAIATAHQNKVKVKESWEGACHGVVERASKIMSGEITGGLRTGLHELDKLIYGLRGGDMVVLAARPSNGKTSLAMNIVETLAIANNDCMIASCEMSEHSLAQRMIQARAGVTSREIEMGFLNDDHIARLRDSAEYYAELPIHVEDCSGAEVSTVRAKARALALKRDLRLVVVDYLQLLSCREKASQGRTNEVGAISANMKAMAKELDVPVLVLSQLSRATETRSNPRPMLADLRDSGAIEQDADIVIFIHRPCKYEQDPEYEDKDLAILCVEKARNGETGDARVSFIPSRTKFVDREESANVGC